ncbi:hypothetical protein CLV84_1154 [Neolewinella xylanilytica]|uniref:Uncharacterized protein n=1 Tax=Neolewinella xylanilytica TaxID=1514080 RepID=A0A2S6I9Q2_9BACT|nr:hypothetical protein [Neolewinella xylanilytica]PPK88189.1 hypothetical protein CLV84_1154 [Neolewinella xylanilytica]
MVKTLSITLFALTLFRSAGCSDDARETVRTTDCGPVIQVRDPMPRLTSDAYTVVGASADGLCLSVTISATGCSSEPWRVALHTDGAVAESSPTQTTALLVFDDGVGENEMTCQAIIEETYQFDLGPYLADALPTTFSLTGTETTVEIKPE